MNCRQCGSKETRTTATEHHDNETWRYCRCLKCEARYKTVETYARQKPGPKPDTVNPTRNLGAANGASVLTEKDVRRLRRLVATGVLRKNIAKEFGIATATVSRIATRKLWAHI